MADIKKLHDLFIHQLKDAYSAEQQLTKALPKMKKLSNDDKLSEAFEEHLKETENQIKRLERVFSDLDEDPKGEKCKAMEGLVKEGEDLADETEKEGHVICAALIAAAQKVEHYEIATYGSLIAYAKSFGYDNIVKELEETLKEEKNADSKLNKLAEGYINEESKKGK